MFRTPRQSKLEVEIEQQFILLRESRVSDDREAYSRILDRIERLHKLRSTPDRVSRETWALIGANLLGIAIIITHEYTHPVTTKALSLAMKAGRAKP